MFDAIASPQDGEVAQASTTFRPVHYLGSKLRFLPELIDHFDQVDPGRGPICDLFAGSGTVSLAAARTRRVFAVDIQAYSQVLCRAVLSPIESIDIRRTTADIEGSHLRKRLRSAFAPLLLLEARAIAAAERGDLELLRALIEDGSVVAAEQGRESANKPIRDAVSDTIANLKREKLTGTPSVCGRHYGGAFFSFAQAIDLDALAIHARSQSGGSVQLAAVLGVASDVVNTVGRQFAQPLRLTAKDGSLKRHLVPKILKDRALDVLTIYERHLRAYLSKGEPVSAENQALRGDFAELLPQLRDQLSLVYADPPYTRDHYSRFYHVLETIALGDDPRIDESNIGTAMSRGFYRADRFQSDFCIKSKAPSAFGRLFNSARDLGVPLLLSYSGFDSAREGRPRLLSIEELVSLARNAYGSVEVTKLTGAAHSKLTSVNLTKGPGTTSEILLTCLNPLSR